MDLKDKKERILKLRKCGFSYEELALYFDTTVKEIRNIIERNKKKR